MFINLDLKSFIYGSSRASLYATLQETKHGLEVVEIAEDHHNLEKQGETRSVNFSKYQARKILTGNYRAIMTGYNTFRLYQK